MKEIVRRIARVDLEEERDRLEADGWFMITKTRAARGSPSELDIFYQPCPRPPKRSVAPLRGIAGVTGRAEMSRSRNVVRRLFDLSTPPSTSTPRVVATRLLRLVAPKLGITANLAGVKYDSTKRTILGAHVLFQQFVGQTPISGAWVRVDIDPDGRVYSLQNDLVPHALLVGPAPKATVPKSARRQSRLSGDEGVVLSDRAVRAAARDAVQANANARIVVTKPELTYRLVKNEPRLAWKVVVDVRGPKSSGAAATGASRKQWKLYLDAFDGTVLWRRSVLKERSRAARVFDPNPVAELDDITLRSRAKDVPETAYRSVMLPDVPRSGLLDGPYVTTRPTTRRIRRRTGDFDVRRRDRGFTEVMVYYHIDRLQRHLQAIGFVNLLAHPLPVNVAGQRDDNSYYDPARKEISLGTGGVDDGEDAETVIHEYGHALQDAQIPGFGESAEAAAMGEGFGDFLAASTYADAKTARLRPAISSWDCIDLPHQHGIPCLRRLDSTKRFPRDFSGECHDDGEIWSACLWLLRIELGRERAERLVVAHHYLLNRWAGFEDAANAILTTDRVMNQGRHEAVIRRIFKARGILRR
jgi:hypothetical protein